jgi:hypothetical protein
MPTKTESHDVHILPEEIAGGAIHIVDFPMVVGDDLYDPDECGYNVVKIEHALALMDSLGDVIDTQLGLLELHHPDDSAKEVASVVRRRFRKMHEKFIESLTEPESRDWMARSLFSLVRLSVDENGKARLLLPAIRAQALEIIDDRSPEDETEQWIAYSREQFGLSEDFR